MKIENSICMATYNGEKYIKEQIESIQKNMKENDELIISDDGSTDSTIQIINQIKEKDNRIRLYKGPQNGVKKNFENAIKRANGRYIFLSDQDDIWVDNKMEKMLDVFYKKKCLVITHNAQIVDANCKYTGETLFDFRKSSSGILKNIYRNSYVGCCMAFDGLYKEYLLPIPNDIEMHDQWIGVLLDSKGKSVFMRDELIMYRRHEENVSKLSHYPISKMIKNRIIFIYRYIQRKIKKRYSA